jgi:hypothetical protein
LALIITLQEAAPLDKTLVVERGRADSVAVDATADSIYEEFRDRAKLVEADHDASDRHVLDLARGLSHVQGVRVADAAAPTIKQSEATEWD